MKYAVIELLGKQHKIQEGEQLIVDRLEGESGQAVPTPKVLMIVDNGQVNIGTPTIDEPITLEIVKNQRGEKIRVATYKAKARFRKVKGHRQYQTVLKVISIGKSKAKETPKPKTAPAKSPAKKTPKKTN